MSRVLQFKNAVFQAPGVIPDYFDFSIVPKEKSTKIYIHPIREIKDLEKLKMKNDTDIILQESADRWVLIRPNSYLNYEARNELEKELNQIGFSMDQ